MADIAIPEIECWDDDRESIPRTHRTENPPLSSGQQQLWFLDQLEPGQAVYNVPMALRLLGDLDILDLESSLSDLWWRHDALRCRVETTTGEPRQETCDVPLIVGRIDFRHEPDPEARVMEWAAAEGRRPFDPTPYAIVTECAGERRTYAELNSRANQLAHFLQTLGVGAECRVGICLERSLEMLVALLGTLKAGAAYYYCVINY